MDLKNINIAQSLIGKKVKFTASCDFFPNTGIIGRIIRLDYGTNGELIYIVKTPKNGIEIPVGSNTAGLNIIIH